MPDPLVSVVLPVRDGERFLAEAIESVLGQEYERLELIVVDGWSTDRSAEIARSYPRVRYLLQSTPSPEGEGSRGLADAWNQAIGLARGSLVAFISSDDRWTPDKLRQQVERMVREPELAYTIAHFRFFLEPGHPVPRGFDPGLLDRDLVGRIPETLVARRETFESVGDFRTSYAAAHDVDWFLRAQEANLPMAIEDGVLLHKRVHDQNVSSNVAVNTPALFDILRDSLARRGAAARDAGPELEERT
jgi:glycosyltransferase involved in cell wall biosynthesis